MAPKKEKKKKQPLRGKKPPKKTNPAGTAGLGGGGTMNSISSTLSFSVDATAVAIDIGTLEAAVSGVNVFWNGVQIFSTNAWDDPLLNLIASSCTSGSSILKITLVYPTITRSYQKTLIFPTPSGHPTVTLTAL